jgi:hypothetical protein
MGRDMKYSAGPESLSICEKFKVTTERGTMSNVASSYNEQFSYSIAFLRFYVSARQLSRFSIWKYLTSLSSPFSLLQGTPEAVCMC